jgi:hypothetical protein
MVVIEHQNASEGDQHEGLHLSWRFTLDSNDSDSDSNSSKRVPANRPGSPEFSWRILKDTKILQRTTRSSAETETRAETKERSDLIKTHT